MVDSGSHDKFGGILGAAGEASKEIGEDWAKPAEPAAPAVDEMTKYGKPMSEMPASYQRYMAMKGAKMILLI